MAESLRSSSEKLKGITLSKVEYEEKELGRGAYGTVCAAKYNEKLCAAKKIHNILIAAESEAMKNNFVRECCQCSSLSHPNIVEFFGIHYPDQSGIPVMIMELMDESLTMHMEQNHNVPLKVKVDILLDVAQGLAYLHNQNPPVVHRDLSPNNILLKKRESVPTECLWVAKLADMGVAKAINVKAGQLQKLTKAPGTADFMPQEVMADDPKYDSSLDVFSYGGVVLFVASHMWPTPTQCTRMDPVTNQLVAFTEVQRRQKYLDLMSDELKLLKNVAVACLDNVPDKRPAICKIAKELEIYKQMIINPKLATAPQLMTTYLTYDEAKVLLDKSDDSAFLVRKMKECDEEEYEICLRWKNKTHRIKIFEREPDTHSDDLSFSAIAELIQYYKQNSLGLPGIDTTLKLQLQGDFALSTIESSPIAFQKPENKRASTFGTRFYKLFLRGNSTDSPVSGHHGNLRHSTYLEHAPFQRLFSLTPAIKATAHETTMLEAASTTFKEIKHDMEKLGAGMVNEYQDSTLERSSSSTSHVPLYEPIGIFRTQSISVNSIKISKHPSFVTADDKITLEKELWYYSDISRAIAVQLLKTDGDFLLRYTKMMKCFVLTSKWNGTDKHFMIRKLEDQNGATFGFEGALFPSVSALVKHHVETKTPVTKRSQAILKTPVCWKTRSLENITHDNVILDEQPMGKGFLGETYSAILKDSGNKVCVKQCFSSNSQNKQLCLNEAEVLKQLNHHNIVKLLGICTDRDPIYLVTETLPGGNFLTFLQKTETKPTPYRLLRFSLDAALGMEYVASQKYIHRDLACRNCWIDRNLKISGFGLCRKAENGQYLLTSEDQKTPSKWTAPEVFSTHLFTGACDVWSYGVLLYEVYSAGSTPYSGMNNAQAREFTEQGHRMEAPEDTPKEVYEIMSKCWIHEPEKRLKFSEIVTMLKIMKDKIIVDVK